MNEQMIFQNMSALMFNAINRGTDRDTAIKEAEETMRLLIQKSRSMAVETESAPPTPGPGK
jgi:hypothetical protein